jgi:hypothetical protein
MNKQYKLWGSLLVILIVATACNFNSGNNGFNQEPTTIPNEISEKGTPSSFATPTRKPDSDPATASPTRNSSPTSTAAAALSPTPAALCSTIVNLKIRSGPGTAYEPPITAVGPNTRLVPFGFNPVGIPGGSWVLVSSENGSVTGWVSASPDFLTCNIDLASLPPVQVAPPPPTPTPKPTTTPETRGSSPKVSNNGGGGECPQNLTCDITFSPASLYAVNAHFTDSQTNGDGIEYVRFSIWNESETFKYYERKEGNPVYCTFGGDGPCNGWIYEDGAFRWNSGGDAVEPGVYVVIIDIQGSTPDEFGNSAAQWNLSLTISAP